MNKALYAFLFVCTATALAQQDDFNDGNADGWTEIAPLAPLGGTVIGVENGQYKLSCAASPNPQQTGPARAGAVVAGRSYSRFCVMTDIVDYSPAGDLSAGLLARIQPGPGAGNVNGYALTVQLHGGDIQISRVTGETPHELSSVDFTLVPGHSYRVVFTGHDLTLRGWIFDLVNLAEPLAWVTAFDGTYTEGINGLLIYDEQNASTSAAFDNFFANDATPPPLLASRTEEGFLLSWDAQTGLGCAMETSVDLIEWGLITPAYSEVQGRMEMPVAIDAGTPARWFRLFRE